MSSSKDKIHNLTIDEKLEILERPMWNYIDIIGYFAVCSNVAQKIIKEAKKNGGETPYSTRVTADSVLKQFGTSRFEEIKCLRELKYGSN